MATPQYAPQPYMDQSQSYGQPPYDGQPPKKSNVALYIIIGIAVVVVICVIIYMDSTPIVVTPTPATTPSTTTQPTTTPQTPPTSLYSFNGPLYGVDYPGNDLGDWETSDPEECAAHCLSDPACNLFVTATDRPHCWIKSAAQNKYIGDIRVVYPKKTYTIPPQ
jgi:hypothetical protein